MSTTDSTQTAAKLLECVSAVTKSFEAQYRENGTAYNVFKIAGIDTKETAMCRGLADLLNPKGLHYQGSAYLELFMDTVVKPLVENAGKLNVSKAKVTAEHRTSEGRRIDIVIDDGIIFIPIEVKIYAGEQEAQLADYATFSREMNSREGFIPVLFLTPHWYESGEEPSNDYVQIYFEEHIIPWLKKCISLEQTNRAAPIVEMLKQFTRAIKSFCGCMEDEAMENAINALITESKDNYAASLLIGKALEELEHDFDNKVWDIFKGKLFELVKSKIPDVQYLEDGGWYYFYFLIGNGCGFSINYDIRALAIEHIDSDNPPAIKTADKIRKTMSGISGIRNAYSDDHEGGSSLWNFEEYKYPGLENVEDGMYKHELYHVYSQGPQAVADTIVSWVTALKGV